jgi:hypothetical protein
LLPSGNVSWHLAELNAALSVLHRFAKYTERAVWIREEIEQAVAAAPGAP